MNSYSRRFSEASAAQRLPIRSALCCKYPGLVPMAEPSSSVDDATEDLGVSEDTTYARLVKRGMPAYGVGQLWTFNLSSGTSWLVAGGVSH